nr:MAG TPA: hypothetical protein [Caudoviricetes sp.]
MIFLGITSLPLSISYNLYRRLIRHTILTHL